jgi:predicted transcriptional regulator
LVVVERKETRMANVTVRIDDDLLARARWLASQRKTSINAIVKEKLEEFVATDHRREAALRGLEDFYARSSARVGNKSWTRDEIHER